MPRKLKETTGKAGRRGNNEGSIFQRKDGRWCAEVTVGYTPEGKPIRKTIYGKTRQEVAKKLAHMTNEVFEKGYVSASQSRKTLFLPTFMDWYRTYKEPTIGSLTREKNGNYIKAYIKPAFENVPLASANSDMFQKLFNSMDKKGICPTSIRQTKQLLNQFFKFALKKRMVRENPLEDVVIRTTERNDLEREAIALTPEQRKDILAKLKGHPVLRTIVIFLFFIGVRPGELIALRWKDIRFQESVISIRLAAQKEIDYDDDGNVTEKRTVLGNTKSVLSMRSLNAPKNVMECLWHWFEYQTKREAKTGLVLTAPDSFVFCTEDGEMRTYSGLKSLLDRFLKKHGMQDLGINLYTFRHTFATVLLEKGINPKIVQELMGHKKVELTLGTYSHVISRAVFLTVAAALDNAYEELAA